MGGSDIQEITLELRGSGAMYGLWGEDEEPGVP